MSDMETIGGGQHRPHHHGDDVRGGLSHSEKIAVHSALSKLTGGGTTGTNGLLKGLGTDTFAGGSSGHLALARFASDTVLGGSGAKSPYLGSSAAFQLSSDTIGSAGVTAKGIKGSEYVVGQHVSHTVTLTDKTTVTLTGVHSNAIVKPIGH